MVSRFVPAFNEVYFVNQYTLIHILEGSGAIQVDFNNYLDWNNKLIYLEKGQYIKFLSNDFVCRKIEFQNNELFQNNDVRVLFKHLVTLGYINFNECLDCQKYLEATLFSNTSQILDISTEQWFWQNPFHADKDEYHLIFDVKDVIDQHFDQHLKTEELIELVNTNNSLEAHRLMKDKVGLSIKSLLSRKRILESKKEIAFTDKNIQEIAYNLGFKDPAYFQRVFNKETGKTPNQFRSDIDFLQRDTFVTDIVELLKTHHHQHRSLDFYADKMHMSVKNLSKKVRDRLNVSLGQLIRQQIVDSAKKLLQEGAKVKDVAYKLGFEESNHFSLFFKHYTNKSPSDYQS